MKKTHELPNGTVLEVGKKYCSEKWEGYIEVDYLGKEIIVYTTLEEDEEDIENTCSYSFANNEWNLQPYTEPKKKVKVANYAYISGNDRWFESGSFYKSDE